MSSNKYGYIADTGPEQAFRSNTGVFDPADINELIAENKWTNFGQLELIETQTVTSTTSAVEFLNLGNYNVHFIAQSNVDLDTDGSFTQVQLSSDGGTSYTTTGYQYARQRNYISSGTGYAQEGKSTNTSLVAQLGSSGTSSNEKGNSYAYLYNLLDSTKYSFGTFQAISVSSTDLDSYFGAGVLPTAAAHNAIRITANSGDIEGMNISLYGIRFA
tara:strand:- start:133 stop:780 length:648 start_codon:yes stop_codon:yes gene_type:complete